MGDAQGGLTGLWQSGNQSRVWGDSLFPLAYRIFKLLRSNERWKKLELILTCLVQLGAGDTREEGGGDEDRKWLLMQNTTQFSYLSLPAWGVPGAGAHTLICLDLHGAGGHTLCPWCFGSSVVTNGDRKSLSRNGNQLSLEQHHLSRCPLACSHPYI